MLCNATQDGNRHLRHLLTPHVVPLNVGITAAGEMKQPSVGPSVPIRETNQWRGLSEHNSRRFYVN